MGWRTWITFKVENTGILFFIEEATRLPQMLSFVGNAIFFTGHFRRGQLLPEILSYLFLLLFCGLLFRITFLGRSLRLLQLSSAHFSAFWCHPFLIVLRLIVFCNKDFEFFALFFYTGGYVRCFSFFHCKRCSLLLVLGTRLLVMLHG